jgi:predicted deacylase
MPNEVKVGNVVAKRGETKKGYIDGVYLNNGVRLDIPVFVANGAKDGKTLVIRSTEHGTEIQGVEVIIQVFNQLDPKKLRGTVIGLPVCNPSGLMANRYRSWVDHRDLGAVRADGSDLSFTGTLAHILWTEALSKCDATINMHCNTRPDSLLFSITDVSDPRTRDMNLAITEAFGYMVVRTNRPLAENAPPTYNNMMRKKGVNMFTPEFIDGRWISEPNTSTGIRGCFNVMKVLDMIDGEVEEHPEEFFYQGGVNMMKGLVRPKKGGFVRLLKKPGELIKKDETFAEVYNALGETLEEIKMPFEGYVWSYPSGDFSDTSGELQTVNTGCGFAFTYTHEEE